MAKSSLDGVVIEAVIRGPVPREVINDIAAGVVEFFQNPDNMAKFEAWQKEQSEKSNK